MKMHTVIKVMESLVEMNGWKVERFDIQHYKYSGGIEGYVGYLDVEGKKTILIRGDGSFEYKDN